MSEAGSVADWLHRRRAFGAAVAARRKNVGLSQWQLADRAGYDRQSINRIEHAMFSTLLDRLWRLAEALECPLSELIADVEARLDGTP